MGITRSELLTRKCERRCKSVTVDGEEYYLRSLSAKEYSDVEAVLAFSDKEPRDWFEYKKAMLVAVLADEQGNRLLMPDDADELEDLPPMLVQQLFERAQVFLSDTVDTAEAAKKN